MHVAFPETLALVQVESKLASRAYVWPQARWDDAWPLVAMDK